MTQAAPTRPAIHALQAFLALLVAALASHLGATTLSVVPLAEALQNPELAEAETDSDKHTAAVKSVTTLLLNLPDESEISEFNRRLSNLARHRDTRVGRLFFSAIAATPDIENVPDHVERTGINASWPLALGASIRVRVEYRKQREGWRIAEFEVTVDGIAGAPVAGMAPYFGKGEIRPLLLDLEAIDYVIGRDPDDRSRAETERTPFNYDEALQQLFRTQPNAVSNLIDGLTQQIRPGTDRTKWAQILAPHLATKAELDAMKAADAEPETRQRFWAGVMEHLKAASVAPRAASMAESTGARVEVRWHEGGESYTLVAQRLAPAAAEDGSDPGPGMISLRGKLPGTEPGKKPDEESDRRGD